MGSLPTTLFCPGHVKVRLLGVTQGCDNALATHVEPDDNLPWQSAVGKTELGLVQGSAVVVRVIVSVVDVSVVVVVVLELVVVVVVEGSVVPMFVVVTVAVDEVLVVFVAVEVAVTVVVVVVGSHSTQAKHVAHVHFTSQRCDAP